MTDINNLVIEDAVGGGFVLARQKWPLNISFSGLGTLKPLSDITPIESVQLCMMLACGSGGGDIDYPAFVKENGLGRHFTK